jgi:Chalcone isomerase-like
MSAFLRFLLFAGIAFATLATAADELSLNGSGIRKRAFFQVYSIGLYLPKKTTSAEEAVSVPGPKRVEIKMLRDVSAEQFSDALADGIRANHSEADAKALEPKVKQLAATMAEVKEAKKGMAIVLEWNGKATQVLIDGKPSGAPIQGDDFYRALLRIWLGDKPVQDDLKKALLGAAQ